ncbi:MAG: LPS export ABC transporter periplasmic protein LptC [Paracoccaceae bacterium]
MAQYDSGYSRLVAWLKVILPLAALALLSTLFLLSRSVAPVSQIPFSKVDLQERAKDQQLTRPSFAGATEKGDLIRFTAESVRPDSELNGRALAISPSAQIDLLGGAVIAFKANEGEVDQAEDEARLRGDAVLTSSTGYTVRTQEIVSGMEHVRAHTPGPVAGEGPPGSFSAGRMDLTTNPETGAAHLVFTGGVHLIYEPGN